MPSLRAYRATGNITVASFVTIDSSVATGSSVKQAVATDIPIGIAQQGGGDPPLANYITASPVLAAQAGQSLDITPEGEVTYLRIGAGGCAPGDFLKPTTAGAGIKLAGTASTLEWYGARALQTAASGTLALVLVTVGSIRN
jgi:hypothetical protein